MTRKEDDIQKIKQIIASTSGRLNQFDGYRNSAEQREQERKDRVAKNTEIIRKTGIVDLINEVCDQRLIVLDLDDSKRKKRAEVYDQHYDRPEVEVRFNYGYIGGQFVHDSVRAYVDNEGVLVVEGNESCRVVENINMSEALGNALANPSHISWS